MNTRRLFLAPIGTLLAAASATAAVVAGPGAAGPAVAGALPLVLGSPHHYAPYGTGWGEVEPAEVYNGGDPAGDVIHLTWRDWGTAHAYGRGQTYAFKPQGGYYRRPVPIVLRAGRLGSCADGTRGYTRLFYRAAPKPGAPIEKRWHPWASRHGDICGRD